MALLKRANRKMIKMSLVEVNGKRMYIGPYIPQGIDFIISGEMIVYEGEQL